MSHFDQTQKLELFYKSYVLTSFLGSPLPSGGPYPNPSFLGTPSQGTSSFFLCFFFSFFFITTTIPFEELTL